MSQATISKLFLNLHICGESKPKDWDEEETQDSDPEQISASHLSLLKKIAYPHTVIEFIHPFLNYMDEITEYLTTVDFYNTDHRCMCKYRFVSTNSRGFTIMELGEIVSWLLRVSPSGYMKGIEKATPDNIRFGGEGTRPVLYGNTFVLVWN